VDGAVAQATQSLLSGSGGALTGPLYLSGDPTQPLQAADKHYVDSVAVQAGSNMVSPASPGQAAIYAANGTSIGGTSALPVSAGGTGATTAANAVSSLGGVSLVATSTQSMAGLLNLAAPYDSNSTNLNQAASAQNVQNVAPRSVKEFGAKGNGIFSDFVATAGSKTIQLVDTCCGFNFTPSVVGDLISLPMVDADHKTLYTTITGYIDGTHVTVAATPTYSFNGTGTWLNQAMWMTDDSAAISTAIAGITSGRGAGIGSTREGGGAIVFPCGYYGISTQLSIPGGVIVEGFTPGCAVLMYMGTAAVDAAVEVSPVANTNWLRNGFYFNPNYTNHAEIGACSGTTCSPAVPSGNASGAIKNLRIYGNKYSNWALSVLFPYDYLAENITMAGGATGCFYTLNDVEVTWTHLFCNNADLFGHGSPLNGLYFDGSGAGQGPIPMLIQSPWITGVTGTAMTFNWVGGATVTDGQISVSHQSLNAANAGGITFNDTLFEGGATGQVADMLGSSNTFIGGSFTGTGGVTLGMNNTLIGTAISGSQTVSIAGRNNRFIGTDLSPNLNIADTSKSTLYTNIYASNALVTDRPVSEEVSQYDSGDSVDPIIRVKGSWRANSSSSPGYLTYTQIATGKAWRAVFEGNWSYYGVQAGVPAIMELTDTNNTLTVGAHTFTVSIASNGRMQITAEASDNWARFNGFVTIYPRSVPAGTGGSTSLKLAGNLQAPGMQIASGGIFTGNQGDGSKVQHSTGSTTAEHCAKFDANGNVVDAGTSCGSSGVVSIANGSTSISGTTLAAGSCSQTDTVSAPGVIASDVISISPSGASSAANWWNFSVTAYPTVDHVNFYLCNWSGGNAAPNMTVNWRVQR
jgi:hypothetical protein